MRIDTQRWILAVILLTAFTSFANFNGFSLVLPPFFDIRDQAHFQFAAMASTYRLRGLQLSPLVSTSNDAKGWQVGLFNMCNQSIGGVQLGVGNGTGDLQGWQFGAVNQAERACGLQFGLANFVSREANGVQVGITNEAATKVTTNTGVLVQIGLLNCIGPEESQQVWPVVNICW